MNWTAARAFAVTGTPIRRAAWVDRWISYDQCLWWVTPFNCRTRVSGSPRIVQANDWTASEFKADDWTITPIPEITALPAGTEVEIPDPEVWVPPVYAVPAQQTVTWNVTKRTSTSSSFPGRFATTSIANPFSSAAHVYIFGDMDDDTYIVNIGQFMKGIDHACRGSYYNDVAKRTSVLFTIGPGESVNLEAWDAVYGNEGGVNTLIFAET